MQPSTLIRLSNSTFQIQVSWMWIIVAMMFGCNGEIPLPNVASIKFTPNPATMNQGLCQSEARIVIMGEDVVSPVLLEAKFEDQEGNQTKLTFEPPELWDVLGAKMLTSHGLVEVQMVFDVSSLQWNGSIDGWVILSTSGILGLRYFVGSLRCEIE